MLEQCWGRQSDGQAGRQAGKAGKEPTAGRSWRVYWGLLDWACASGGCVIRTRIQTCVRRQERSRGAHFAGDGFSSGDDYPRTRTLAEE